MVTVTDYPRILRQLLETYAELKPSVGEIESEVIIDEKTGHYELMRTGWIHSDRVHGSLIHIDLRDGKFWIQYDGTETGIAHELVDAGVPKEHIVLAFRSPEVRKLTGFAVS